LPNLDRVPSKGDQPAAQVPGGTPPIADPPFLDSISADAVLDLGRYGTRQTTIALRRGSANLLTDALLATAIAASADEHADVRDLLVGLALPHVAARELGIDPVRLFTEVAGRVQGTPVAQILVEFGHRRDVDLPSFGWERVETAHGPDFIPR
jgi:hypothetical protein